MRGLMAGLYRKTRSGAAQRGAFPVSERRAGSSSPLLRDEAHSFDRRARDKRLFTVGTVLAAVGLFCLATETKLWPAVWPFDGIYRAHDVVWLPLKGWLWTAWYPWCLVVWLPVVGLGVLGLWSWASGKDPSRPLQRTLILMLSGLLSVRFAGKAPPSLGLFRSVVGWSRWPMFGADYMEMVIRNALDHQLEQMEAAVLAGQEIEGAWLRRTDRLMRARALFPAASGHGKHDQVELGGEREKKARWLEAFFDLAFLSHVDRHQDIAIADHLAELLDELDDKARAQLTLLDAFLAIRPFASCQSDLWLALMGFDTLASSATAQHEQMRRMAPNSEGLIDLIAPCSFAFLAVADKTWAVASLATLAGIERAYNALRLSDDYQADADQLAWWIGRSRLATIRLFHQQAHRRNLPCDDLTLWPDGQPVYHALTGGALAAGGE